MSAMARHCSSCKRYNNEQDKVQFVVKHIMMVNCSIFQSNLLLKRRCYLMSKKVLVTESLKNFRISDSDAFCVA